jgi:hypothetical protein
MPQSGLFSLTLLKAMNLRSRRVVAGWPAVLAVRDTRALLRDDRAGARDWVAQLTASRSSGFIAGPPERFDETVQKIGSHMHRFG